MTMITLPLVCNRSSLYYY